MQIHNEDIFHCVRCGKMVRQKQQQAVPYCCDAPMARAACQTVEITAELGPVTKEKQPETPSQLPPAIHPKVGS